MDKAYLLYLFLSPSFFQVPCLYHLMPPLLEHPWFTSFQNDLLWYLSFKGRRAVNLKEMLS